MLAQVSQRRMVRALGGITFSSLKTHAHLSLAILSHLFNSEKDPELNFCAQQGLEWFDEKNIYFIHDGFDLLRKRN